MEGTNMRVVTITTTVTPERTLTIRVPEEIPTGPAEVIVVFAPESPSKPRRTLGDLRASEFFNMWQDRTDLSESPALARTLREQAWKRSQQ
jgi:hypothetical protein